MCQIPTYAVLLRTSNGGNHITLVIAFIVHVFQYIAHIIRIVYY